MVVAWEATCTVKGGWEAALVADAATSVVRSKVSMRATWQSFI
jgi:hypothetical protein